MSATAGLLLGAEPIDTANPQPESPMSNKPGGIAPNDFTTALTDLITARTREESAAGSRRSVMARFEKLGAHKPGLQLFLRLRKMEPADAELTLASALRYCRFAQLEIGDQASLFGASDDAGAPSKKSIDGLTDAVAYEEGFRAGRGGRNRGDHRYEAGTPMHARFDDGWAAGQEALIMELGDDAPANGEPARRKTRAGAEQRVAAPSGGRRRNRSESRAGA